MTELFSSMNKFILGVITLVLAAPVTLVLTFLLTPFWRWLEATTAIESIGHSGPANWCFVAVYVLTLLLVAGIGWFRRTGAKSA